MHDSIDCCCLLPLPTVRWEGIGMEYFRIALFLHSHRWIRPVAVPVSNGKNSISRYDMPLFTVSTMYNVVVVDDRCDLYYRVHATTVNDKANLDYLPFPLVCSCCFNTKNRSLDATRYVSMMWLWITHAVFQTPR